MEPKPLDPVAQRVLGSLIEKELATPDNYPLTLNGLTAACNQRSNRDPVMELDESEVVRSLDNLAGRGLARGIHPSSGRVMRYREELREKLHLHPPELAIQAVLLLRGPQTVGEIKARTSRLFEFIDLSHVEITLGALADLSTPLVTELPRRPGQKENRWAQRLGGPPGEAAEEPASAEVVATPAGTASRADRIEALEQEVAALREEVAELRVELKELKGQFA